MLTLLAQGYFNQDWVVDYESASDVVDDFAAEPAAAGVVDEINRVVDRSEDDLRRILIEDLDCGYDPADDGIRYRDWLDGVARRVRERHNS